MASYEQIGKKKLWSVRFREIGTDGMEHNARLSGYRTKKEAERAYLEHQQKQESERRAKENATDLLFEDVLNEYIFFKEKRVKESSLYTMVSKIKQRILPYFAGKRVRDIKPIDIEKWQDTISHFRYAYQSALRVQLGAILKYAEDMHDVRSPMSKVPPLRNNDRTDPDEDDATKYYSEAELSAFLSAAEGDEPFHTYFYTVAYLGCRKGEGLALKWADIDFDESTVRVTKTVTKKTFDKAYKVTTPKTKKSTRSVVVSDRFLDRLREYREWQNDPSAVFVFGGDRPISEKSVDNHFGYACAKAEIPRLSVKALRHTCVTIIYARGVPLIEISKRVGHSSVQVTAKVYAHVLRSEEEKHRNVLDDF